MYNKSMYTYSTYGRSRRCGRRSVVNPGTKLWRQTNSVLAPVFVFVKPNKNQLISMKPNRNLNHVQQLLFHTILLPLDQYIFFCLTKKGRQNRSSNAKTGLVRRAGATT